MYRPKETRSGWVVVMLPSTSSYGFDISRSFNSPTPRAMMILPSAMSDGRDVFSQDKASCLSSIVGARLWEVTLQGSMLRLPSIVIHLSMKWRNTTLTTFKYRDSSRLGLCKSHDSHMLNLYFDLAARNVLDLSLDIHFHCKFPPLIIALPRSIQNY